MAGKNPNRIKAYEIYAVNNGNIDLVDIATQLNVPDGTVRGWKSKDKWDVLLSGTFQIKKETERNDGDKTERSYNWLDIEKEYVTDISIKPISLAKISERYNIPKQTVIDQSAKNNWSDKRKEYKKKTLQKVIDKASTKDADRIARLLSVTDRAMDKAEKAIEELETYLVTNKRKTKIVEYKDNIAIGKPTKEITKEEESIETVDGPVDKQGLLFVTNSLKNIKELYSVLKNIEEQDARIASMKSKVNDPSEDDETGVVMLAPVLPDVEEEGE